jgi:hypothetical protein
MFSINFLKTLKANKAKHYLSKQALLSRHASAVCATVGAALRDRYRFFYFLWTIVSFGNRERPPPPRPQAAGKGKL